jgi:restriction endonuclease S subunit
MNYFENIDLPVGWVNTRIGELYQFEYGKGLTKQFRSGIGDYPVYGSNGVVGTHNEFLIEGPALIIGRKGAAGAVSYSALNCWPIDTTYFVRENQNLCLKFSYYLLQSLNLMKHEKSTAIPGLNRNDAYDEPVPLPPLPEQHRIVAKIEELFSELDKGIESLKTAREQLKVYRQTLLKHAFEGKLTAKWREEHNGFDVVGARSVTRPILCSSGCVGAWSQTRPGATAINETNFTDEASNKNKTNTTIKTNVKSGRVTDRAPTNSMSKATEKKG